MQSTFEWRRNAPAHFSARAENARLSAAALWQLQDGIDLKVILTEINYKGLPSIAYAEAFRREAAIALELNIKAVIAQQMHMRRADPATESVPATHNIPTLWLQAGLPELGKEDKYRLLLFKSILTWSGRYATPTSAKAWVKEEEAFKALDSSITSSGRFRIRTPISCGWREFETLYSMVSCQFLLLQDSWNGH